MGGQKQGHFLTAGVGAARSVCAQVHAGTVGGNTLPMSHSTGVRTIMHESTDRFGLSLSLRIFVGSLVALAIAWPASSQEVRVMSGEQVQVSPSSSGQPSPPASSRRGAPARGGAAAQPQPGQPAQPGQPQPGQPGQPTPPPGEKKEGDNPGEKKEPADVQRPDKPPREVDPHQLDVVLNEQSLVPAFNFEG